MRDHPPTQDSPCNQETNRGQKKRRNLMNANSDCEVCGPPDKINNRECQKGFPCGTMFHGFHTKFLHTKYQSYSRISLTFSLRRNPNWPSNSLEGRLFGIQCKQG